MFCARGDDLEALAAVAALLHEATGQRPPRARRARELAPFEQVAPLLAQGYVLAADPQAQAALAKMAPAPAMASDEARLMRELRARDPAVRQRAARRIHGKARTRVYCWGWFLSHPRP